MTCGERVGGGGMVAVCTERLYNKMKFITKLSIIAISYVAISMYVCMCVCSMYVCMYVCVYVCMYVCM